MKRILLLGAGFSRNWGGWLASEFTGELCGRVGDVYDLGENLRDENNFEAVLGRWRKTSQEEPGNRQAVEKFDRLQEAIYETFVDMNTAFAQRTDFEFSDHSVRKYLARFDAIFTLNPDLLLEFHYASGPAVHHTRWSGHYFPGVVPSLEWQNAIGNEQRVRLTNVVTSLRLDSGCQPIFKLHGSVHWRTEQGSPVLVIGTGKEETIDGSSLLTAYREQFEQDLCAPDTQIMVIGYSFSDPHINELLLKGGGKGLKMYLVNPAGLDAFKGLPGKALKQGEELRHTAGGCVHSAARHYLRSRRRSIVRELPALRRRFLTPSLSRKAAV